MKYMGSKRRLVKDIVPIMLRARPTGSAWVEPFVGGANVIDKVHLSKRIGNDANRYLIALLIATRDGWCPPYITREEYYEIKKNPGDYPDELVGFASLPCSFRGKPWGGYAKPDSWQDYIRNGQRNLAKQAPLLKGIKFTCGDYSEMDIPAKSLIYCDPPYKGVAGYGCDIDHESLWAWCREKASEGHAVFVSEHLAPDDFECVFSKSIGGPLRVGKRKPTVEKLFRVRGRR